MGACIMVAVNCDGRYQNDIRKGFEIKVNYALLF